MRRCKRSETGSGGERSAETDLSERHSGDDGEHDLFALGGIRVLLMLLQPGLQGAGGLPGGVFPTGSTVGTRIAEGDNSQN